MSWLNRTRLILTTGNIALFLRAHRRFGIDERYSFINLIRALWTVAKDERIVRHDGMFVHSSFLPPIPSRAAYQVLDAVAGEGTPFDDHINGRRRGAPISMYVAVTGKCGYRCRHCSAAGLKQSGESDEMRGVDGAFAAALAAIRNCLAAGLYTMTQTVAVPGKLLAGVLLDIVRLSSFLGVHEVRVLPLSTSVAGFCLGGAFALDFALRYPEMVAEVYLIETSLGFPILLSPLLLPGFGRNLLHLGLRYRWGAWVAYAYLLRRGIACREEFLAGFAANDVDISRRYIRLVRDYSRIDHFRRVREQLKSPLIIVNGEKSPYYVRNSTLKLLKEAQNTQLHVLHGARPFVVEERPDLLADILAGRHSELPIHPVASPVRKKPGNGTKWGTLFNC